MQNTERELSAPKDNEIYTIERHEASISVDEYLEGFVDIPAFRAACEACPNYNRIWSCPPYDFDVEAYWRKYRTLQLIAVKIIFREDVRNKTYTSDELQELLNRVLPAEKAKLSEELLEKEKLHPGSISLSAGSCARCAAGCSKPSGKPCRFPETMRHSIESLGGNVGLTISKLMHLNLEWMEDGKLPHHFVLVCGLLTP